MARLWRWLFGREDCVSPAYLERLQLAELDEPEHRRYHRPGPLLSVRSAYTRPWGER